MIAYGLWMITAKRQGILSAVRKKQSSLTMNGYEDVHAVVSGITDLPPVINTHGRDHIFNIYFDCDCFLHPDDAGIAAEHCNFPELWRPAGSKLEMPPFKPTNDGDVIDLGGLTLEIARFPGTPEGRVLREKRVLFTGDSINHHL